MRVQAVSYANVLEQVEVEDQVRGHPANQRSHGKWMLEQWDGAN